MPVAVRNATKTIVVLSNPDGEAIEWQYAGHPDGDDIQELSDELWNSVRVKRAVKRGILAESTEEAMLAAYERQKEARQVAHQGQMDEIARVLDTATPNQAIVISADDLDAHIENRDSDGEQLVAEAEVQAQERAAQSEAALAAATNPMAAVNSGV
jgi:hypothetical protein